MNAHHAVDNLHPGDGEGEGVRDLGVEGDHEEVDAIDKGAPGLETSGRTSGRLRAELDRIEVGAERRSLRRPVDVKKGAVGRDGVSEGAARLPVYGGIGNFWAG
jgi:hypothetical protein